MKVLFCAMPLSRPSKYRSQSYRFFLDQTTKLFLNHRCDLDLFIFSFYLIQFFATQLENFLQTMALLRKHI